MQSPIVIKESSMSRFKKKVGLSDIEIRGMRNYLDEYVQDVIYGDDTDTNVNSDRYFEMAFSSDQLNCCGEALLPGITDCDDTGAFVEVDGLLESTPVSHFWLTESHCLMATFFVGEEEKEVYVRMN